MGKAIQWSAGKLYQGEYECPSCGQGSKDLIPTALAEVLRAFGGSTMLKCQICGARFMRKAPKADQQK